MQRIRVSPLQTLRPLGRLRAPRPTGLLWLPGERLLIVENESCQHQLPNLPEAIAVLGAGFDLGWAQAGWVQGKQIGYWGDIDTWGLQFLASVRRTLPHLDALMMTPEIYERNLDAAVAEPVVAATDVPADLNPVERSLYERILSEPRGRLEQEFLPESCVHETLRNWCGSWPTIADSS